jgi:hypothetical protein
MYKLKKALYGLKQTQWAWYGQLIKYMLDNNFKRKQVDMTLS